MYDIIECNFNYFIIRNSETANYYVVNVSVINAKGTKYKFHVKKLHILQINCD